LEDGRAANNPSPKDNKFVTIISIEIRITATTITIIPSFSYFIILK
jgi:hypothetical protein